MPQEGGSRYEESFTSFLAGVLYTRRNISNLEFFGLMNRFEEIYNVTIYSGEDIKLPIYLEDRGIYLRKNYDDIVVIDNKNVTVKNYLYSLTTPNVREFFSIPSIKEKTAVKFSNPFVRKKIKRHVAI